MTQLIVKVHAKNDFNLIERVELNIYLHCTLVTDEPNLSLSLQPGQITPEVATFKFLSVPNAMSGFPFWFKLSRWLQPP